MPTRFITLTAVGDKLKDIVEDCEVEIIDYLGTRLRKQQDVTASTPLTEQAAGAAAPAVWLPPRAMTFTDTYYTDRVKITLSNGTKIDLYPGERLEIDGQTGYELELVDISSGMVARMVLRRRRQNA